MSGNEMTFFTIDVKALYPSVKFPYLFDSLKDCFKKCTAWTSRQIAIILEMIFYTLQHQQLQWDGKIYLLKQGIPTGAKHSVPLANIFLTYILKDLINTNEQFNNTFVNKIVLWKRFIDDCGGLSKGNIQDFMAWLRILKQHFQKYELELTADTNSHTIDGDTFLEKEVKTVTFLDIDIYINENNIHTKEHRKETSTTSYLNYTSAHPRYTFKGIMKSQLYRIRRLCSRESDYKEAVELLKQRCTSSGYKHTDITDVFENYEHIPRSLEDRVKKDEEEMHKLRLITLAGTQYGKEMQVFASRMNRVLFQAGIRVEIVKTTGQNLARSLFNNNNNVNNADKCGRCIICRNGAWNTEGVVTSTVTGKSYKIPRNLNCAKGGIYVYKGPCDNQYSGKTTVEICDRTNQHIVTQKTSSVYKHRENCGQCRVTQGFSLSLVEECKQRGKFSLSEREYLWNYRIKGSINDQKTLLSV